jgi:hypothetical protein
VVGRGDRRTVNLIMIIKIELMILRTLLFLTLCTYKSAIIDLYMQQKGMNMNDNEHPGQAPEVRSLMDRLDQYK